MKLRLLKLETVQSVVALACAVNLICASNVNMAFAATPTIGTVAAKGSFRVDDAAVAGNATLFEGTTVETHTAGSTLDLLSGARLSLASESKGRIFSDRLILEKGSGQIEKGVALGVEARGLMVRTETADGSARVVLAGARVQVAAMSGSVRVLNSQGSLVAAIRPGNALEFAFQASGEPWKLTGCLRAVPGHYLVTDEVTNVTVEVSGSGLDREAGNRVEVTGANDATATPVSGVTQYIRVSGVKRLGRNCVVPDKAAAAGSGGGAGKAAGAGKGVGIGVTTVAVIGGVAAAAVIGGLAAAGSFSGSSAASVSR